MYQVAGNGGQCPHVPQDQGSYQESVLFSIDGTGIPCIPAAVNEEMPVQLGVPLTLSLSMSSEGEGGQGANSGGTFDSVAALIEASAYEADGVTPVALEDAVLTPEPSTCAIVALGLLLIARLQFAKRRVFLR